jgi:hypothetical protein
MWNLDVSQPYGPSRPVRGIALPFTLPLQWLIIDINSLHRLLRCVIAGDVADVSELHSASIFTVEVSRLVSSCI